MRYAYGNAHGPCGMEAYGNTHELYGNAYERCDYLHGGMGADAVRHAGMRVMKGACRLHCRNGLLAKRRVTLPYRNVVLPCCGAAVLPRCRVVAFPRRKDDVLLSLATPRRRTSMQALSCKA